MFLSAFHLDTLTPSVHHVSPFLNASTLSPLFPFSFFFALSLLFLYFDFYKYKYTFIDGIFLINLFFHFTFHDVIFFEYFSVNHYFKLMIPTPKITENTFHPNFL